MSARRAASPRLLAAALLLAACGSSPDLEEDGGVTPADARVPSSPDMRTAAPDMRAEPPEDMAVTPTDGSAPAEAPHAPPAFTASSTASSITATITAANGATRYEVRVDGGAAVEGLTVPGLSSGVTYAFQVQGVNAHGASAWSEAVDVTTEAGGVAPLFEDDFESGDFGSSRNGFSWAAPSGDVSVSTENPRSGSHSARFAFGPNANGDDDTAEMRFALSAVPGTGPEEVWFEYDWYVPPNYEHRSQGGSSHHKFFAVWNDTYNPGSDGVQAVMELWRTSSQSSYFRTICYGATCDVRPAYYHNGDFVTPAVLGQWNEVKIHLQPGSSGDGLIEVWLNDVLKYRLTGVDYWPTGGAAPYFRRGYLMGYTNGGYDELTVFYIDNFKVFDADPGWGL